MNIWYSYKGRRYEGTEPYCDLKGVDWYDALQARLPEIRQRALDFLRADGLEIQEYFNKDMVEGTKWESVAFEFWGHRNEKVIQKDPELYEIFNRIPGMVSLSVSRLQPRTHIKPHYGDTDAIYRIHLPLYIPAGLPDCGIKVGGIDRPWMENEMIVFTDACKHEAWNMTDKPRMVMIFDVIRPQFLLHEKEICDNIISAIRYQYVSQKLRFVKKWPGWMKDLFRRSLKMNKKNIFEKK